MYPINLTPTSQPPRGELPAVIEAPPSDPDAARWVESRGATLDEALYTHGALLLRGFDFASIDSFDRFLQASGCHRLAYQYRSTTRHLKGDRIYTASEYSPAATIMLHSENAYQDDWPMKLFFYCKTPAAHGGQTPIASNIRVAASIPPEVLAKFARLGLLYVRNYPDATDPASPNVDLAWQTVFQTESRDSVEHYCREHAMQAQWHSGGTLRTRQSAKALVSHPKSGKLLWFNQAHVMHTSNMEPEQERALRQMFAEEALPRNCYYGDGTPIERHTLDLIRSSYVQNRCVFDWNAGDVLVLDNMLVAHGRLPFRGDREVLLAMADSYRSGRSLLE